MRLRPRTRIAVIASLALVAGFAPAPYVLSGATTDLAQLRDALVKQAPAGSSGYVDPETGRVVLKLAGEPSARLQARLAKHPRLVHTERGAPIVPTMLLYGGLGMSSETSGQQCTTGFIATRPNVASYVITAGHCVRNDRYWERKGTYLGEREPNWVYGEQGDFALIKIKGVNMSPKGWINTPSGPIAVTDYRGEFWRGQNLCYMGNVSRLQCGTVTAYGVTVTYKDGPYNPGIVVSGLVEMDVCAKPGDSGGPLFSNDGVNVFGMGITSGATELACTDPNFRAYFQPLQEILEFYNDLPLRIGY